MADRPLAAVSGRERDADTQLSMDALDRSGAEPWAVPPDGRVAPTEILRRAGALVLTGGSAIDPDGCDTCDRAELALTRAALVADVPIYGICRGMWLLNAALGGGLPRLVDGHAGETLGNGEFEPSFHHIYISPGSKLAAVVGSGGFVRVNSVHRLGVREAQKSPRLVASAYSLEDGLIEALESPEHRWVIAVQFRPDRRMDLPPHFDRLFQSLAERAAERLSTISQPQNARIRHFRPARLPEKS